MVAEQEAASLPRAGEQARESRAARLGPFLCWAVVFADLGTSVYYTPGILFQQPGVGQHAALFVGLTLIVFILLTRKYGEVAVRYPGGGGVVTVTAAALHPFAGVVGGMFILVDYFLTAALSALSGIIYLSAVFPALHSAAVYLPVTIGAIVLLGLLNLIGVSESARVNASFATIAALSQLVVVLAVIARVGPAQLVADVPRVLNGPHLTPVLVLTGYAGAFLAFSGLESISQLSPVMAEPRQRTTRLAMGLVICSMVLTSPLLTLWSTTVLPITATTDPNQVISLLAGYVTGRPLEIEVALSGALLLVFASNTAIIGSYHVFLALARMRFLPGVIEQRNRLRGTPHWAILTVVAVPVLVLVATQGSTGLLGDMYAFGLLGAFSLTCVSLDVVRWRERRLAARTDVRERKTQSHRKDGEGEMPPIGLLGFGLGVITTVLVVLAWSINLVAKPLATEFGGAVSLAGVTIALATYATQRRRGRAFVFPQRVRTALPDAVMVLVPPAPVTEERLAGLVGLAGDEAGRRPVVFVYRGSAPAPVTQPRLFEVVDPYFDDRAAQDTLGRVERLSRRLGLNRRYVYIPAWGNGEALTRLWQTIRPRDTLIISGDEGSLREIAADRVRRPAGQVVPVVHYLKHWA